MVQTLEVLQPAGHLPHAWLATPLYDSVSPLIALCCPCSCPNSSQHRRPDQARPHLGGWPCAVGVHDAR